MPTYVHVTEVPEERQNRAEKVFEEIMSEHLPKLMENPNLYIQTQ